jgi:hypothetical protein
VDLVGNAKHAVGNGHGTILIGNGSWREWICLMEDDAYPNEPSHGMALQAIERIYSTTISDAEDDQLIPLIDQSLALLSDYVHYRERESEEYNWLIGCQSKLLTDVANALKGEPGPLSLHDWSDLPLVARQTAQVALGAKARADTLLQRTQELEIALAQLVLETMAEPGEQC